MGAILLPGGCCCVGYEPGDYECDYCKEDFTPKFMEAVFSDVARGTGCYVNTFGGYVDWMTPPDPAFAASYILEQLAPSPGYLCGWGKTITINDGVYAFYGEGDSDCETYVQSRSLDRLELLLVYKLVTSVLTLDLAVRYYKTTVAGSQAFVFGGTTETDDACEETTVIDNDLITYVDTSGSTVWGSAGHLGGIAGGFINGSGAIHKA